MKFYTYLLRFNNQREANLEDFATILKKGEHSYNSKNYLFKISTTIIENRFFWLNSDFENPKSFRTKVLNKDSGQQEPNPRSKSQIELRNQFFACYDSKKHYLYLSDQRQKNTFGKYLNEITRNTFTICNIYTSLDDFCKIIKKIKGFKYTQTHNLLSAENDLFKQIGNIWGQDLPEKLQIQVSYNDMPIHRGGRAIIDLLHKNLNNFDSISIIGCDDQGLEHAFDFSKLLSSVTIHPCKDENDQYDSEEIREMLLNEIQKLGDSNV